MADAIAIGGTLVEPEWIITDDEIRSINAALSSTLICDRMDYDVLTAELYLSGPTSRAAVPRSVPYGTPIWWVHNGDLIGKFYAKNWIRTGPFDYKIEAVSAVGVLDGIRHYGGIYANDTFEDVLGDIIGNAFEYTIADDLKSVAVLGWLPIASARENLHQLLFAEGAQIVKDATGEMVFRFPDVETTVPIETARVYMGGSVDFGSPVSGAEITEHSFFASPLDREITLFDNTDGSTGAADHQFVAFEQPCHGLVASAGLTINSSGANYAYVSGLGTLTGYAYTHTTNVISATNDGANAAENIAAVSDAYLVSALNSQRVLDRVLSYYTSARKLTADINLGTEQPGMQVSLLNAFQEPDGGFISDMELQASSIIKATCSIISGYNPTGGGNNFSRAVTLTGNGAWAPPEGVTKVRVVLIGGGDGGSGGHAGAEGNTGSTTYGTGGVGGQPGAAGSGGKILVVNVDLSTYPPGPYAYHCGEGGTGGLSEQPGSPGGSTTVGPYSSADGTVFANGFLDVFSGEVFGIPGTIGIPGGKGISITGTRTSLAFDGSIYYSGKKGGDYADTKRDRYYMGGGGGGPAAGANGGDGYTPTASATITTGGTGASAIASPAATIYGQGGQGGHGGGGGGGSGVLITASTTIWSAGGGGAGGAGGQGGKGGDGCIIIYY